MMQIRPELAFNTSSTDANVDFDPGVSQGLNTLASDERIRIGQRDDDPRDSGRDDGLGAGAGLALVTAWLKRRVESCSLSIVSCLRPM